jgi:hypothetical protein
MYTEVSDCYLMPSEQLFSFIMERMLLYDEMIMFTLY